MDSTIATLPYLVHRDSFLLSTEKTRIDVDAVHDFLASESYWVPGITKDRVVRSIANSLCFGVYDISQAREEQVGFARVITDYAGFAYLADLFILSPYRGQGLGKWLVACILAHPGLQDLRKWMLNTKDAHGLYRRFGFQLNKENETYMVYKPRSGIEAGKIEETE
jgi:GNAT superfamily N-acetyltransferase